MLKFLYICDHCDASSVDEFWVRENDDYKEERILGISSIEADIGDYESIDSLGRFWWLEIWRRYRVPCQIAWNIYLIQVFASKSSDILSNPLISTDSSLFSDISDLGGKKI